FPLLFLLSVLARKYGHAVDGRDAVRGARVAVADSILRAAHPVAPDRTVLRLLPARRAGERVVDVVAVGADTRVPAGDIELRKPADRNPGLWRAGCGR